MALEPVAGGEIPEEDNSELSAMTQRFWVGLALTISVLVLSMGGMVPGLHELLQAWGQRSVVWVQFALSTPVVLWAGWPFFERGARSIVSRHLNMFTLVAMGTGASYLYSVVATLFPAMFPLSFRRDGMVEVYFEAAAMITVAGSARPSIGAQSSRVDRRCHQGSLRAGTQDGASGSG